MPELKITTHLLDLIGQNSHTIINLFPKSASFFEKNPKIWAPISRIHFHKKFNQELSCINDSAERALLLITNIHSSSSAPKVQGHQELSATVSHIYKQQLRMKIPVVALIVQRNLFSKRFRMIELLYSN